MVCITRNAEARTNAAIARIAVALENEVESICLLTRNRYAGASGKIKEKKYRIINKTVENYEIELKSEPGKGLGNIFQLIIYMFLVFKWFLGNRNKYEIIHAFDLDTGLPALLASTLLRKKYVYHIADFYVDSRGNLPRILKAIVRKLEYLVIDNRAETTIICTEDRVKQIAGSHPKKLVVIHNTPSLSKDLIARINDEKEKVNTGEEIVITYVGGLTESRFIKSAIDVIKRYPKITLNLAGMGALSEYVKQAANDYKNINYYGIIDYIEALRLYSKTDFMLAIYDPKIPNHRYSAPNKIYEAMMLGKPIIVAKGTGIDQLVSCNNIGISIEYTENAFEQVICEIIRRPDIKFELGCNAQNAYSKYSWSEMENRIIKIYRDIS